MNMQMGIVPTDNARMRILCTALLIALFICESHSTSAQKVGWRYSASNPAAISKRCGEFHSSSTMTGFNHFCGNSREVSCAKVEAGMMTAD